MTSIGAFITGRWRQASAAVVALCLVSAAGSAWAKTPDGMPPSQETVCSALSGAAFGLCNAYCEAQDCDVHSRPSCPVLRKNFAKITGSAIFPCDRRCGNGTIDRGEDCDPPGSACADGATCTTDCTCPAPVCGNGDIDPGEDCDPPGSPCNDSDAVCSDDCTCPVPLCGNEAIDPGEDCDPPGSLCSGNRTCTPTCTCPAPVCGDGVVDPGEACDPPGSMCTTGVACSANCGCGTEPTGCCECLTAAAPMCQDGVTPSACQTDGCLFAPSGTSCDPVLGRCVPVRNCCQCPNDQCQTVQSPDLCPAGCTAVPAPSMCDAAGICVSGSVP